MLRKSLLCAVLAALVAVGAWAQAAPASPTADELIEKNLQARGGREKMKAVNSLRMTGKSMLGPNMEAPFTIEKRRPDQMRLEFTIQGMTGVQAFDGTTGWALMPFMGKTEAEPMSADDLKQTKDQADMDGPLMDYKEKGHQVELLGKADVEGTPAWKLKLTKKNGDVATVYLDADSFLEIKTEDKATVRGQEVESETTIGDYKEVNGVLFPFSIQSKMKGGGPGGMTITVEKLEVNPEVAASRFAMPAATKTEGAAKPPQ